MNDLKYIVACINGLPPSDSVSDYSAWISKKVNKSLKLLYTLNHKNKNIEKKSNLSGSIGLGAKVDLLEDLVEIEHKENKLLNKKAKLILEEARERLETLGIEEPNLCLRNGRLVENLLEIKDNVSLIVLGRYGERHQDEKSLGIVGHKVEAVIKALDKPILVVSKDFVEPKSLVLAFDGSRNSYKALNYIKKYELFKSMKIHIIYVGEKSEKSIVFLNEAEESLKSVNLNSKISYLEGNADEAIFNYLNQNNIEMLVMGAFGHNWVHDLIMGSFTSKILAKSELPLFLIR